jgi:RNA polymerase sigma-70 factor (ECF subfamily)
MNRQSKTQQRNQLGEMYSRFGASVFRRARSLLGDPDRARDATQEVFLRAMRNPARVGSHPLPWLYRVTTNLCLNTLRDRKRRGVLLSTWPIGLFVDGATEARVTVSELLARVPDDLQEIAIYYYVDDLSHEDIAEILGVSRRTVGNRLAAFHALTREIRAEDVAA